MNIESWGWLFEWTPAFIGSGILIGMNSALSLFGGAVLAWAIIGPVLVHYGECIGKQQIEDDPRWADWYSFASFSNLGHETPSPRCKFFSYLHIYLPGSNNNLPISRLATLARCHDHGVYLHGRVGRPIQGNRIWW